MGYTLKAYIGKRENLTPISESYHEAAIVDLNNAISMIPITDELFDEINEMRVSDGIDKFSFLNENLERKTIDLIGNREVAYVESEFFGGQGGHIGLVWKNGKRNFVGKFGKNAMNEILKRLGVNRKLSKDEFETIGLDRNRHTEDWVK